ncbi:response regulator [Phenylobacterium sp.]|uniref:response regulator n=1 Tax=Phenylobacterium sp. TaxID=1871053 RepID=UPI002E33DB83|nr:response regulator [Phenylobacterium sp.]HEX2559523.1 response regulator [Phenylobacterium sp.]
MFSEDQKIIQRVAPALQRVLIIDPQPASARMLAEALRNFFTCQVWIAPTRTKAIELLQAAMPQLVFVELSGPGLDGIELTRQLRRSEFTSRKVPVIVTTATATAQSIVAARDAGAHEFLRKPYTSKDLLRRLEAVALKPRPWVEAVAYVGPDRRRFNSGEYSGRRKRKADLSETPEATKVAQAFKILNSAALAMQGDPSQALRSMRVQAADLHEAAVALKDVRLARAAGELQAYLAAIKTITAENALALSAVVGELLKLAPVEVPRPAMKAA